MGIPFTNNVVILDRVTITDTSEAFDVSKRQQITLQFTAAGISTGNGVFTVDVSNDGTNWTTGVAFLDALQTATSTFSVSKTLSTNTTAGAIVIPGWRFIRVKVTVTTDGTYTCVLQNGG